VPDAKYDLPLVYLGWGSRRFGENPLTIARRFGYSYSLVVEGSPDFLTDKARVRTSAGSLIISDVDSPNGWRDKPNAHSKVLVWIWRDRPHIDALDPEAQGLLSIKLDPQKLANVDGLHRGCRQELARLDSYSSYALAALQRELDVELLRARVDATSKSAGESRYAVALNWMRHNLNAQHPVAELAVYLNVSESTVQRIIRRRTSESPLAVFQNLKAMEAKRLLQEGRSVKSVAYELGYKHPNDFSRFYTKSFGHAPTGRGRSSRRGSR